MCKCKICESSNVLILDDVDLFKYKNETLSVNVEYSLCSDCGREFLTKEQIIQNEVRIRDKKKSFDGLMSSSDMLLARQRLNITQEEAALIFGGGKNAFSKYERGEVSQSVSMDKLIKVCLKHRCVFEDLARDAGVSISLENEEYSTNVVLYSAYKRVKKHVVKASKSVGFVTEEVCVYG